GNSVRDSIVSREPIESLEDLAGKEIRIADQNYRDRYGSIQHPRGNHILETLRAGISPDQATWIDAGDFDDPNLRKNIVQTVADGKADTGCAAYAEAETLRDTGLHAVQLPTLPMINGATITTTFEILHQKEALGERLVRAQILAIHYAKMHPEEAQKLLD